MTLLTLKQIAQQLDRPESTIRHWRDQFEPYIPVQGQGRKRRYPAEATEVFAAIAAAFDQGLQSTQVETQLQDEFGMTLDMDVSEESNLTTTTQTTTQQPDVREFMAALMDSQRNALQELRKEHQQGMIALQTELEVLKQALAESAAAQEQLQSKAELALENAVTAKELIAEAQRESRAKELAISKRDTELMEKIRQLQKQQQEERNKPLWKRLLGK